MHPAIVRNWTMVAVVMMIILPVNAYFDHDAYLRKRMRGGWGGGDGDHGYGYHAAGTGGGGMTDEEHETIQNLFDAAAAGLIERQWQFDYVNTTTTCTLSTDPQVSDWIREHVTAMMERVHDSGSMVRPWDPLFAALFEHHDEIDQILDTAYVEDGKEGVRVIEVGTTKCGTDLAQAHAAAVSNFIEVGRSTLQEEHEAPASCEET